MDDLLKLLGTLQVQANNLQLAHWNLKASDFITIHTYLGENYDATAEHIDAIAEFIRKIDSRVLVVPFEQQIAKSIIKPILLEESSDRAKVIEKVRIDLVAITKLAKEMFASTTRLPDVNDYMAVIVADMTKRFWFFTQSR